MGSCSTPRRSEPDGREFIDTGFVISVLRALQLKTARFKFVLRRLTGGCGHQMLLNKVKDARSTVRRPEIVFFVLKAQNESDAVGDILVAFKVNQYVIVDDNLTLLSF